MIPKAIQTQYRGNNYRSRLEARWAVFFHIAKIETIYEGEGYQTSYGRYLPDFYLPEMKLFIDVKGGGNPDPHVLQKLRECCKDDQRGAVLEQIPLVQNGTIDLDDQEVFKIYHNCAFPDGGEDGLYLFCKCPCCGTNGFEFNGRSDRIECTCHNGGFDVQKDYNYEDPILLNAYKVAKSARFEHGRRGEE